MAEAALGVITGRALENSQTARERVFRLSPILIPSRVNTLLYAVRLEMKARKTAEEHIDSGDADMNIWDQVATTKKL